MEKQSSKLVPITNLGGRSARSGSAPSKDQKGTNA